jgi:hypothetical protein
MGEGVGRLAGPVAKKLRDFAAQHEYCVRQMSQLSGNPLIAVVIPLQSRWPAGAYAQSASPDMEKAARGRLFVL